MQNLSFVISPLKIFHEFCKQVVGLEAAQLRKEEAVRRHFRLGSMAQSLLQRAPCGAANQNNLLLLNSISKP